MPNKFNKQPEPDEPETFFSRQEDTLEASGRFAQQSKTRTITGGSSYPRVESPLTTPQPDHGFVAQRDRVDQVTSMTFDQDLTTLSGNPPQEPCLVTAPATDDGEALTPAAAPSSLSRRRF
jgi:hypothetical protein